MLALVKHPDRPARVAANLATSAKGQVLTVAPMDVHNSFQQPQAVVPEPLCAERGSQGRVLDVPPKSVVVVGI